MVAKIELTDEQKAELIRKNEEAWVFAQKMAEVGEFSARAANKIYEALSKAGYEAENREAFFGTLAIFVTIAKELKMPKEEIAKMVLLVYGGVKSNLDERVEAIRKEVEEEGKREEAPAAPAPLDNVLDNPSEVAPS